MLRNLMLFNKVMEMEKIEELMINFDFIRNPVSEFITKHNVSNSSVRKRSKIIEYSSCNKREKYSYFYK